MSEVRILPSAILRMSIIPTPIILKEMFMFKVIMILCLLILFAGCSLDSRLFDDKCVGYEITWYSGKDSWLFKKPVMINIFIPIDTREFY